MVRAGYTFGARCTVILAAALLSLLGLTPMAVAQDEKPAEFVPGPLVDYGQKLYDLTVRDQDLTAPNGYDAMMRIGAILDELDRDFAERYGGPDKKPEEWPESVGYPIDVDALARPDTPEESKRITREYMARIEASGIPGELKGIVSSATYYHPRHVGPLIDMTRGDLAMGRKLMRYLRGRARDALRLRDWDRCVGFVLGIRGLGRTVGREPIPIAQIVGLNMELAACDLFRDLAMVEDVEPRVLATVSDWMSDGRKPKWIIDSIEGDQIFFLETVQRTHDQHGVFVPAQLDRMSPAGEEPKLNGVPIGLMPLRHQTEEMGTALYNSLRQCMNMPRHARPRQADGAIDLQVEVPRAYFLAASFAPSNVCLTACNYHDTYQLRFRATRLIIALERCRLARGMYPEKLSELVPEFLSGVPEDPYSESGFVYKRGDNPAAKGTYTLYSVGDDGEDNGGLRAEHEHDALVPAGKGTDFVFMPPTAK